MSRQENLLLEEAAYSGKVYYLSEPKVGELNFGWLENQLNGQSVSVSEEFEIEEGDGVHIPEIFKPDDEEDDTPNEAIIEEITRFHRRGVEGITGFVKHNKPDKIVYEGTEVFLMESIKTNFIIFESDNNFFLSMLGPRREVNAVMKLISEILEKVGFEPRDIHIGHNGFEGIVEEMVDSLKTTTVEGYASPNIDSKVIRGEGYRGDAEYERESRVGNISGQQFGTRAIGEGQMKTVQISDDGLVRSYSKITLADYIDMIANFVLDNVEILIQSSLTTYVPEDSRV